MDSIGFVLEEIIEIPGTISDLREQTNRKQKLVHLSMGILTIVGILAFMYFEIKVTVDSYKKPSWSATEEVYPAIPYPTIILCPRQAEPGNPFKVLACYVGDSYLNITANDTLQCTFSSIVVMYNYTPFSYKNKTMNFSPNEYTRAEKKMNGSKANETLSVYCEVINPNISTALYSTSPSSILLIYLNVKQKGTLLSLGFFDQNEPVPNMNNMPVAAITTPGNVGYILLTRSQNTYLNGRQLLSFDASITTISNPTMPNELILEISYSSLTVVAYEQYVAYDWIWLAGIISGILAFGRSLYILGIMIVDAIFFREKKDKKDETGAPSEKESLLANNITNTITGSIQ